MTNRRYFGEVVKLVGIGAVIVRRDDGGPDAFLNAREAAKVGVGEIHAGDRIEFSVAPGAAAVDVMLCAYSDERHRV
jgi:cold shock CspA family protein